MAIPELYWMMECTGCRTRRVVFDCYLVFVGFPEGTEPITGGGYTGPPLPERYSCTKGCAAPMRVIGSMFDLKDRTMRLHEPYEEIKMNWSKRREWKRLVREAGMTGKGNWFTGLTRRTAVQGEKKGKSKPAPS